MRPVLLPVHSNTFFVELFRVAKLLKADGRFQPVVFFSRPYPTINNDIDACLRLGIRCLDGEGHPVADGPRKPAPTDEVGVSPGTASPGQTRSLRRQLIGTLRKIVGRVPGMRRLKLLFGTTTAFYLDFHRERQAVADRVLRAENAVLLVMAGDMPGYDTSDFIAAGHRLGIPSALVPSTMSNGLEQAEVYYHDPLFHLNRFENWLAAWRHPKWIRTHRGRRLLRRPGGDVMAMEKLGTAPPLPWIFNSGFADAVCAESDAMIRYYRDGGLPAEPLVPTGSLANDVLAEHVRTAPERRPALLREVGLDPAKPMMVVALPPDFLYMTGGRPECDFRVYDELVAFWMGTLRSIEGWNIVMSLHPSVPRESMRHLETERIRIGPPDTASLIAKGDLFVASVSSTIRWAIAAGKPVVNYDVYRYRYDDYVNVPGVLILEEQAEFVETMRRLTTDLAYLAEIRLRQRTAARSWGALDGNAGRRMIALFESLLAKSRRAAA